ncbi:hypothetical protein [Trueperella pecoris]|uniref:hypothetical protein n=1 Tax=Trueperella pecoris TaxID=2733571 RepID=UPI00186BA2DB|nr:hypothetical protein [Trueperella pecoris]QOQ38453.1 hypothetical protein HLG82_02650 [Trueperella pecoris]
MSKERDKGSSKFPPAIVYVLLVAWVAAVLAAGFLADVQVATYLLSASLVSIAAARVALPNGAVPWVRTKAHDATVLMIGAVLLFALAAWGNTPPVP